MWKNLVLKRFFVCGIFLMKVQLKMTFLCMFYLNHCESGDDKKSLFVAENMLDGSQAPCSERSAMERGRGGGVAPC